MKIRAFLTTLLLIGASSIAFADVDNSFLQHDGVFGPEGAPGCTGVEEYQQPLDAANFSNANTSDVQPGLEIVEDIVDGAGTIVPFDAGEAGSLRVWGLSIEFDPQVGFVATCTEDNAASTPYIVSFYADNAGAPAAAPSFTTTATPTAITDTGIPFAFTTIFETDLALDTPAPAGFEWVSVVRETGEQAASGNDCYFLWVNETLGGTYDDDAISITGGPLGADQTLCIGGGPSTPIIEVPTVNGLGLLALIALLAGCGLFVSRRFN